MKIADIIYKKGFSGYALAQATGLTRMAIKNVIDGKVSVLDMKVKNARKLANALGYTLDELIEKTEEK